MHEHALNGIVHVFAVFAALAGENKGEAVRVVEDYLVGTLGLRRTDPSFGIFGDLLDLYAAPADPAASGRALDSVCKELETRLAPGEKQLFLLHSLQIRHALPDTGERADRLLGRVAAAFHVPDAEWTAWRCFIAAGPDTPDGDLCRCFRRAGWRAVIAVLHSPWTERFFIRALRNEVFLDDNPVATGRFHPLAPGAILRDAGGQAVYRCEIERLFGAAAAAPIRFEAENVGYRFPGGEGGIRDFSFRETGGRLVGVMGGSGVGKSTLVQLLNGSLKPQSGCVLLNGIDLHGNPAALEGVVGSVPQDDLLFEDLTVRENLDYNARLCLAGLSDAARRERVRRMLVELQQEEIADLKVGDPLSKTISGGQRKRLNIALELIREPSVLFVDEPTSGLSSADSDVVMGLLKAQAARGRLVIAIVHQPSSNLFRQFDALWILDKGGVPIYMGHPLEAARHFRETAHLAGADRGVCPECGNVHPEQIFSLIESKAIDADGRFTRARQFPPEFWHAAWRKSAPPSTAAGETPAEPPPRHLNRPGWQGQLRVFWSRTLRARAANRAYVWVNLLEPPALAGLTAWLCHAAPGGAYVFGGNPYLPVYFFMAVIVAIFLGLSVSAEEIVRDRRVLRRERFLHLSWSAYSGAKMLHVAGLALLQTALCAAIGVGVLRVPGFFGKLWFALFSAAVFGGILGLNVSARFKSAVTAYILLPLLLLPQMLLGGLIVDFDDLRPRAAPNAYPPWIGELTASRWAFEALAVEQYQSNAYQRHFEAIDRELSGMDYRVNDYGPALLGRLDALVLAAPERREEIRALLVREFRAQEGESPHLAGAAAAVAGWQPPDRAALEALKTALREWMRESQAARQTAQTRRDAIQEALLAEQGEEGLAAFVKANTNRKLGELVRRKGLKDPLREQGGRLVRLSDPVCQPAESAWGRAPFMAGEKRIGTRTFRTYGFDLGALWLMNAVLAICLAARRPKM